MLEFLVDFPEKNYDKIWMIYMYIEIKAHI